MEYENKVFGDGPRASCLSLFHQQLLLPESTPTGTKSLTSERRGASWLSKPSDVRRGRWREARKRFFFFLRSRSLIEATVTGALSRPRRSAARTPSRTLSLLL